MLPQKKEEALRLVTSPTSGPVLSVTAPPPLVFSSATVDFTCGLCGTVLMCREDKQVDGLLIHCTQCGSDNATG
jgi:hypothetical protein